MIKNTMMMNRAVNEFDEVRGRMAGDFKTMIADSEELLKAAATLSGEGFAAARTKFEEKLRSAKTRLADASQPMLDKTRETAAAADEFVRANPWTTAGIALAAGVLIGSLAAKR